MVEEGLLEEVSRLYSKGKLKDDSTAAQAIGYKEILPYIKGEASLEDSLELLKKNTRNYAKRQITWFKRYNGISLVPDNDEKMRSVDELADEIIARL